MASFVARLSYDPESLHFLGEVEASDMMRVVNPQDRQIVLYCKTGVRSAEALAAVKAAGFRDAVHVQGGVVSWVRHVDPSLPIY